MLQQALSWAMFLVERINNLQNMSADVCNYAPSNMSHVCEMLNHPDACQLSNLWPESFDVDLLRIGATLLGIHRLDQGGAVYLWLRSRIQVLAHCKCTCHATMSIVHFVQMQEPSCSWLSTHKSGCNSNLTSGPRVALDCNGA